MNNPTKIMIDSCVTFKMLTYSKCFNIYGQDIIKEIIDRRKEKVEKLEKSITADFIDKFNNEYADYSFQDKIDVYKEYISKEVSSANKHLISNFFLSKGITVKTITDKKTKEEYMVFIKEDRIPEENRKKGRISYEENKAFLKSYKKYSKAPSLNKYHLDKNNVYLYKDIVKYKELQDQIKAGELFLKMLDGEFQFYIPSVSLKELINHTKDKVVTPEQNTENENKSSDKAKDKEEKNKEIDEEDEEEEKGWLKVSEKDVEQFIKNYASITYSNDKNTNDYIENLASEYRVKSKESDLKEMDKDINSLDEFGDSKIMAMASLSGIPLVTFNGKDFIKDTSIKEHEEEKKGNERKRIKATRNNKIRKYIASVNSKHDDVTDAYAYSVEEVLEGNFHKPEKECQIETFINKNIKFFKDLSELLDIVENNKNQTKSENLEQTNLDSDTADKQSDTSNDNQSENEESVIELA